MKYKKKKIFKIAAIVLAVFILVNLIGTIGWYANYHGYFHKGNRSLYALKNVERLEQSLLEGKHIAFLGSSVTEGARSKGVSFVEYMGKRNGFTYVKEAVSGTTLVDNSPKSYVQRLLNNFDQSDQYDLFICQLSTNDASQELSIGKVSESQLIEDFDTTSVIGAMEFVISYVRNTWGCPVVFYTGTKFESDMYQEMVDALYLLQEKWGIGIIDLWNGLDVNIENYELYMADKIHPTQAGYLEWWTPYMEKELYREIR